MITESSFAKVAQKGTNQMSRQKLDYVKIRELSDTGATVTKIAETMDTTPGAVSKVLKKMGIQVAVVTIAAAPEYREKNAAPGAQVWTAAAPPETNLRRLQWGHLNTTYEKTPNVCRYETRTDLMIARNPMEFICGVSIPTSGSEQQREAKFSGKHAPHLMFILDEADAVPDEVYRGIESYMSGGNTRLLCMFNPRTPSGAAYRMIRDGKAHV